MVLSCISKNSDTKVISDRMCDRYSDKELALNPVKRGFLKDYKHKERMQIHKAFSLYVYTSSKYILFFLIDR